MWTGDVIGSGGSVVLAGKSAGSSAAKDYQNSVALCAALRLGGYSDWRLPTYTEMAHVVTSTSSYYELNPTGVANYARGKSYSYLNVEFDAVGHVPFWTSTPDGNGGFKLYQWPKGQQLQALFISIGVFCVRPMEPGILELAKQAHTLRPVTGISQLKSYILLLQADDDTTAGQFQSALDISKQALLLDPTSAWAYWDMGMAYSYLGQWDNAISALQLGNSGDQAKFITNLKKQSVKDPNVLKAWVLNESAFAAINQKRYQDAINAASETIALEPKWPQAFEILGEADGWIGQWDKSLAAFKMCKKVGHSNELEEIAWAKYGQKGSRRDPKFIPEPPDF